MRGRPPMGAVSSDSEEDDCSANSSDDFLGFDDSGSANIKRKPRPYRRGLLAPKCGTCGFVFPMNTKKKCSVCNEVVYVELSKQERYSKTYRDQRVARGLQPYMCHVCSFSCRFRAALTTHQNIHRCSRPYICYDCHASFGDAKGLRFHSQLHNGEDHYACDACEHADAHESSAITNCSQTVVNNNTNFLNGTCNVEPVLSSTPMVISPKAVTIGKASSMLKRSSPKKWAVRVLSSKKRKFVCRRRSKQKLDDVIQTNQNRVDDVTSSKQKPDDVMSTNQILNDDFISVIKKLDDVIISVPVRFGCAVCLECFQVKHELIEHLEDHVRREQMRARIQQFFL